LVRFPVDAAGTSAGIVISFMALTLAPTLKNVERLPSTFFSAFSGNLQP